MEILPRIFAHVQIWGELGWELVDPADTDPVAQENDKRNNRQIYTNISY